MNCTYKVTNYIHKIENFMLKHPWQWMKIEDIRTGISATRSKAFSRACQELVICGRLELRGNKFRINQ